MANDKTLKESSYMEILTELRSRGYYMMFGYTSHDLFDIVPEASPGQCRKWLEDNEEVFAEMFGDIFMEHANRYAADEIINERWED